MKIKKWKIISLATATPVIATTIAANTNYYSIGVNDKSQILRLQNIVEKEIQSFSNNNQKIKKYKFLKLERDGGDDNEIVILFVFEKNGYAIYDVKELKLRELNLEFKIDETLFEKIDSYIPFVTFNNFLTKKTKKHNNKINLNIDKKLLTQKESNLPKKRSKRFIKPFSRWTDEAENINFAKELIKADYEVPHSWWFKVNSKMFGYAENTNSYWKFHEYLQKPILNGFDKESYYNSEGICMIIALSLLIQYQHFFVNSNWISEDLEKKYISYPDYAGTYKHEAYNNSRENIDYIKQNNLPAIPYVSPGFTIELLKHGWYKHFALNSWRNLRDTLVNYTKSINKTSYDWFHGESFFQKPWEQIYNNRPTLLAGSLKYSNDEVINHGVVAYGKWYDKGNSIYRDKYLVHMGWEGYSQVVLDYNWYSRTFGISFSIIDTEKDDNKILKPFFQKDWQNLTAKELNIK
ncbi:hypothetical protein EG856_01745 [Mycoplasmopsis phocirhinis]|uniref:Uncharacterized protein n=1 Tax=Mycoplasmopsis phocirhinis TaxID=142650 RepID=A0A4P6MP42_9BACT|nr:hypothetical protein [Mycoplasmopsis phocirhinis]QBF34640.1 hypothetical protein EG856_01745 [Mycoplasmopsis phocirhinis]